MTCGPLRCILNRRIVRRFADVTAHQPDGLRRDGIGVVSGRVTFERDRRSGVWFCQQSSSVRDVRANAIPGVNILCN